MLEQGKRNAALLLTHVHWDHSCGFPFFQPVFSEAMQLVEVDGSLVLKVKHFRPDFVAWEEKEDFVRFRLLKLAENEAYFSGLTFRRSGDELVIYIVLTSGEQKTEHELRFQRVPI